jgi:uncharacterized membrane protein
MKNGRILFLTAAGVAAGIALVQTWNRKRYKSLPYGYGIKLKKAITIQRPASELYQQWCNLSAMGELLPDLVAAEISDVGRPLNKTAGPTLNTGDRSHWKIKLPGGFDLAWDAEVTTNRENAMIGWRSLDGSDIDMAGSVRFEPATGARGTVVRVALQYNPPGGRLGAALASLVGERPGGLVEEALRRFKQVMETGEVAATHKAKVIPIRSAVRRVPRTEEVESASEDSFPASDAPSWTGTGL